MAMKKTKAEQLDLFGASLPPIMLDKPIRLIELFGGIGSQAKALERLGADFERWRLVEWAIPSIKAYAAITHCAGDSIVVDVLMDIFNEMIAKKGIRQ